MVNFAVAQSTHKKISVVTVKANSTVSYEGNLADGQKIPNLSWAADSSVACFPATQNQ